jgi:hypothetical protein
MTAHLRLVPTGEPSPAGPVPADDAPGVPAWRKLARDAQEIATRSRHATGPGTAALAAEAQETAMGARRQATQTARGYVRAGRSRTPRRSR